MILALFYFLWSCGETAEFPAALFTHKLYSCPLEGALILKSWVKIATLVINYFKKVLRKAFVLVMWSCSSAGMWLRVIYHLAGCWPGFNRTLHQSTLSDVSIKNTSLLLLFCGRKSGWHNHSPTELVVRKEKWALLSPSNQTLMRMAFQRPCVQSRDALNVIACACTYVS